MTEAALAELTDLNALAVRASTETLTDANRAALQAEFASRRAALEAIQGFGLSEGLLYIRERSLTTADEAILTLDDLANALYLTDEQVSHYADAVAEELWVLALRAPACDAGDVPPTLRRLDERQAWAAVGVNIGEARALLVEVQSAVGDTRADLVAARDLARTAADPAVDPARRGRLATQFADLADAVEPGAGADRRAGPARRPGHRPGRPGWRGGCVERAALPGAPGRPGDPPRPHPRRPGRPG